MSKLFKFYIYTNINYSAIKLTHKLFNVIQKEIQIKGSMTEKIFIFNMSDRKNSFDTHKV